MMCRLFAWGSGSAARSSAPYPRLLAALAAGMCWFSGEALAQDGGDTNTHPGIALDQLDAAPAGDAFFGVPSAYVGGRFVPRAYVMMNYADSPLRIVGDTNGAIVASQMYLNIAASLSILDRAVVSLMLPVALMQTGQDLTIEGNEVKAPTSADLGDLRIGARVRIVGEDNDPAQLAIGAYLFVPTGPASGFTGDGSTRVTPHAVFGGRLKLGIPFTYTTMVGLGIRSSANPTTVNYGAGVAALLANDTLQIGPEFYASTPIQPTAFKLVDDQDVSVNASTNAEVLLGARWRFYEGLTVGAAGGPGLTRSIGTPTFRVTAMIAWAPVAKSSPGSGGGGGDGGAADDQDRDGISDATDSCPFAFGKENPDPKKHGCPVLDDDGDGVPNDEDACPEKYAKEGASAEKKGCPAPPPPPDTDGDTIPDPKDACPNQAGPISSDANKNGCPPPPNPDPDGDGINVADDACPNERGVKSDDKAANGCLKMARIQGNKIAILGPVEFKKGKAGPTVDPASEAVLADVKEAMSQHTEYAKVEIGGYTDNDGKPAFNEKVSLERAEAVKKWLVEHGIAESRLVAVGYGPKNPIADNKSKEGRAKNKRIEFQILEKK